MSQATLKSNFKFSFPEEGIKKSHKASVKPFYIINFVLTCHDDAGGGALERFYLYLKRDDIPFIVMPICRPLVITGGLGHIR